MVPGSGAAAVLLRIFNSRRSLVGVLRGLGGQKRFSGGREGPRESLFSVIGSLDWFDHPNNYSPPGLWDAYSRSCLGGNRCSLARTTCTNSTSSPRCEGGVRECEGG